MKDHESIQAAFALTRRTRLVHVSTNGPSGYPETRVMFNLLKHRAKAVARGPAALPWGFSCWVGTNTASAKTGQIRHDPRVCLYYTDAKSLEGLSLSGRLEEVEDDAIRRAIYAPSWDTYYAGGRDGGDFTLFRFVPARGKYYHGLRVVQFDAAHATPS
jgi:general stress protein 26